MLELGCGNGANLLPQAYYRRHSSFVGVDGAASQVAAATSAKSELCLSNIEFVQSSFEVADVCLDGQFDYIVAHGVFSWVGDETRDALLELCARRLRSPGLFYLNYNAYPGWRLREMVRCFLLANTEPTRSLRSRAQLAQSAAEKMAALYSAQAHPYAALMAQEFRMVCDNDISYIAHEYLAPHNYAYWRSTFLDLIGRHGFAYVGDADFNYAAGRVPEDFLSSLVAQDLVGRTAEDTLDLLCYRQLHSPILTKAPWARHGTDADEFADLWVASCLTPGPLNEKGHVLFRHPSGYEVEAKEDVVAVGLNKLLLAWPRGLPIREAFPDVARLMADVRLLHRSGLIELRYDEAPDEAVSPESLWQLELRRGRYRTSVYHTVDQNAE